jgi:hypothetical protein
VRSVCETTKQGVNMSVQQDGGRPRTGISEILETGTIIIEISMPRHNEQAPEAASVVQQVYEVLSDTAILVRYTPKWRKVLSGRLL